MNRLALTLVNRLPEMVFLAALSAPPCFGFFGNEAVAAGCIKSGQTTSCLKDECRGGFCVHVGTYRTPTTLSTELTVNSRPARGTHINLRCLGGKQTEGVYLQCGGSSISVHSCVRGGLFAKSRCGAWQSFPASELRPFSR